MSVLEIVAIGALGAVNAVLLVHGLEDLEIRKRVETT